MFFGLLTLLVALAISTVAAYYSIVGLMAIFAGAKLAIAIMGVVLEIGKLVVASWTFTNWKSCPVVMRSYFIVSVIVLMFITSLGIFGFLARAHIEQSSPTTLLEERIDAGLVFQFWNVHDATTNFPISRTIPIIAIASLAPANIAINPTIE